MRAHWPTLDTYPLQVFLSNRRGGFYDGTAALFEGVPPRVQFPRELVIADFNGDGRPDIFVADHGYDASPGPGYPEHARALDAGRQAERRYVQPPAAVGLHVNEGGRSRRAEEKARGHATYPQTSPRPVPSAFSREITAATYPQKPVPKVLTVRRCFENRQLVIPISSYL